MVRVDVAVVGVICLAAANNSIGAPEDRRLNALQVGSVPRIDGLLNDDCWKQVKWQSGFRRHVAHRLGNGF